MNLKKANLFRNIARYSLLIIGVMAFLFALFSGAGDYGGGFRGILKNSPNALPWSILLILTLVAWKRELIGGLLITFLGLVLLYFFNAHAAYFRWNTFLLTLLIPMMGLFFILSWHFRKGNIS